MVRKTTRKTVNYDEVSHTYDERYKIAFTPEGISSAVSELVREAKAERILEVGCGTGHWLDLLQNLTPEVYGMDRSAGMLQKASELKGTFGLIQGDAGQIPFHDRSFDLILCINALHHFTDQYHFIRESRRLLNKAGVLSIISIDPHTRRDRWFIYDYFPGTYEADVDRFPSCGTIADWMIKAGFESIKCQIGERIKINQFGREILPIDKNSISQLTLLTPQAFARGISMIETAIAKAEALGEVAEFTSDISLFMTTGWTHVQ